MDIEQVIPAVICFVAGMAVLWIVMWFNGRPPATERRDSAYWRKSYETLVGQTNRDLNDGLGVDPRSTLLKARWTEPKGREEVVEQALEAFFPGDDRGHLAWAGSASDLGLTTYRSEWRSRMRRAINAAVTALIEKAPGDASGQG